MSAPASAATAAPAARTQASWRIAAAIVLIGLAALAGYTMFSGPTTLPSPAPTRVAPSPVAPSPPPQERDRENRND